MLFLAGIILLVLLATLAVVGLATALMWLVKSKNRQRNTPVDVSAAVPPGSSSKIAVCAMCGESRIIIKPEDGLCASCYSALRTKKLQ